mmetsp:Transcript_276/g.244  ORF Transcript_276/g.244 Transcript_276/m.244 type:complete len:120 (+) Transcript_276:70-429(+)
MGCEQSSPQVVNSDGADFNNPDWFTSSPVTCQQKREQSATEININNPDWFTSSSHPNRRKKQTGIIKKQRSQQVTSYPSHAQIRLQENPKKTTTSYSENQLSLEQADHAHEMNVLLGLA